MSDVPTMRVSFSEEFANDVLEEQSKRIEKLSKQDYFNINVNDKVKTYKRRKIRTAERTKVQALRSKLANSRSGDTANVEEQLYITMASYYLIDKETNNPMTKDEFLATEFEEIRDILEACSFRTEKPIPPPLETKTS